MCYNNRGPRAKFSRMFSDVLRLRCFVDWNIDRTIVPGRDISWVREWSGYEAPDAGNINCEVEHMGLQLTATRLPTYFSISTHPSGTGMFSFDPTARLTNDSGNIHPAFDHFSDPSNWQQSIRRFLSRVYTFRAEELMVEHILNIGCQEASAHQDAWGDVKCARTLMTTYTFHNQHEEAAWWIRNFQSDNRMKPLGLLRLRKVFLGFEKPSGRTKPNFR